MAAMTMKKTLGDLVKREFSHDYCRETVTLVAQPGGYPMGAVLGKDSTTGKFSFSPATAAEPADGTEVASAVLLEHVSSEEEVAAALVMMRGPVILADTALEFDVGVNSDELKEKKKQELSACGLVVRQTV